jgi:hypothetical protein
MGRYYLSGMARRDLSPYERELRFRDLLGQRIARLARRASGRLPRHLWHYTDAIGFHGIVKSGALRASHFAFLNDSREFVYGHELTIATLRRSIRLASIPEQAQRLRAILDRVLEESSFASIWVACFSEVADDLSQWRSYGGSADRYAIGFEPRALRKMGLAIRDEFSFTWYQASGPERIIYDRHDQVEFVRAVLECADLVAADTGAYSEYAVADLLLQQLVMFKSDAFSVEREWRLSVNATSQLGDGLFDCATASGSLKPFVVLEWAANDGSSPEGFIRFPRERLPINAVYILPLRHAERAKRAADLFIGANGYYADATLSRVSFVG